MSDELLDAMAEKYLTTCAKDKMTFIQFVEMASKNIQLLGSVCVWSSWITMQRQESVLRR